MSVVHRRDSIRGMRLREKGVSPPDDWNDIEQVRAARRREMGVDCTAAIHAGIEVEGKRYSLTDHDQTEIITQLSTIKEGAAAVPYHADGELCRLFSAEEFTAVATAAMAHIFYHRTYCNHLNAWIREAGPDELDGIQYGAELPDELAASMAALLGGSGA